MSERFTVRFRDFNPNDHGPLWEDLLRHQGYFAIANGCFDIIHPGHLRLFAALDEIAYRRGLRPVVAINSDESVRKLKGSKRPIVTELSRARLINHLKWPLSVVIFDEETPQKLMDLFRPAVVLKGAEYPKESVVRWKDSEVVFVPMEGGWSTTGLVEGDTR